MAIVSEQAPKSVGGTKRIRVKASDLGKALIRANGDFDAAASALGVPAKSMGARVSAANKQLLAVYEAGSVPQTKRFYLPMPTGEGSNRKERKASDLAELAALIASAAQSAD